MFSSLRRGGRKISLLEKTKHFSIEVKSQFNFFQLLKSEVAPLFELFNFLLEDFHLVLSFFIRFNGLLFSHFSSFKLELFLQAVQSLLSDDLSVKVIFNLDWGSVLSHQWWDSLPISAIELVESDNLKIIFMAVIGSLGSILARHFSVSVLKFFGVDTPSIFLGWNLLPIVKELLGKFNKLGIFLGSPGEGIVVGRKNSLGSWVRFGALSSWEAVQTLGLEAGEIERSLVWDESGDFWAVIDW